MKISVVAVIGLALVVLCLSANGNQGLDSTSSYLTHKDRVHLKRVLASGLNFDDLSTVYYYTVGYTLLGEPVENTEEICNYLAKGINGAITVEKASYAAGAWMALGATNCKLSLPSKVFAVLTETLKNSDSATLEELYYATSGRKILPDQIKDFADRLSKAVVMALTKDDSLWNLGYAFHIAADLGKHGAFALDRVEDALMQADELDGQYLQFEGGLSLTGFLVAGMMKLSGSLEKRPPIKSQQMVKLSNYLLSRRTVQTPKGAINLLLALKAVADNRLVTPLCITLPEDAISISKEQPLLTVKVCDILGNPLRGGPPEVMVNSARRTTDDTVLAIKETMRVSATDSTLFTTNLMNFKPDRGFYKVSITVAGATSTVPIKVASEVTVDYLEIGTGDADQTTQPKLQRVQYPESLTRRIEADSQQKLVVRFLLRDSVNKKPLRAHQAFIRLSHTTETSSNGYEIIFVAEPDASHIYKFDMPVGTAATNFGYQSGDYNVELVVGDATITNPFQWVVARVNLKFPEMGASGGSVEKNDSVQSRAHVYMPKPEISHVFREPEKRPPAMVSNLFTGLCLAPVLLLLALWAKLGVNISNFPLSLSAILFHLGLGSIFLLFGIFWLRLNIFVTLWYLLGLGVVTFLAGNKMLSLIAQRHKSLR